MKLFSADFDMNRDKPKVVENYVSSFTEAIASYQQFLGGMQFIGGSLVYVQPATQTDTGLWCESVSFSQNYQEANNTGTEGEVILVVTYGVPDHDEDDSDEEIGSVSGDIGGSMLQLGKGNFEWTSGPKSGEKLGDDDIQPFKVVPHGEVSVTIKNRESVDLAALSILFGKVNSASFFIPGINNTVPANRCRFDGASFSRKFTTQAYPYWDITYKFAVASHDWNQYWDGEQYSSVDKDTFEVTSFAGIFQT